MLQSIKKTSCQNRPMRLPSLLGMILCLPAVASGGPSSPSAPALRLPGDVRPLRQRLDLTLVPEKEGFSGRIEIDVEMTRETSLVWLNAKELRLTDGFFEVSGLRIPARLVSGNDEVAGLAPDRPVGPGRATLGVTFSGTFRTKETQGLFRQKDRDAWYVFSQFEATDARRAFPCFDEPSFKAPWEVTLHVPTGESAFSNSPVASETKEAGGLTRVRFAPTPPLPSYLVAVAAGPFDVLPAGRAGRKGTPIRIITPRGRAAEGRAAAEMTGEILTRLENYVGIPYAFAKLDELAIPHTVAFGAMENPGLVTYQEGILLAPPDEATASFRRHFAFVCAHELAHQWFGDDVTPDFWNDTWLNESFATWMEGKILEEWQPSWDEATERVASRSRGMAADSLTTARRIRQPITSYDDIENAFDGITYGKGAAVLSMFEAWIGPATFRKGVHRYLSSHPYGNAGAADFLSALDAETGGTAGAAFSTFLDQPGVPLVTARLTCSGGTARLDLSQRRFLPVASTGAAKETWQIPVCVRWGGSEPGRACQLIKAEAATIPFPGSCPAWVDANDGASGYYRVLYERDLLERLVQAPGALTPPERVGLLADIRALATGGLLPAGEALALVPRFAKDPDRHVVRSAVDLVSAVGGKAVPDSLRAEYARFLRDTFGERARTLGLSPHPGEDEETRLLRPEIVSLVAVAGEDPALRAQAGQLARRLLADPGAVAPDLAPAVLSIAAAGGDRELFDLIVAAAGRRSDQRERVRLLSSLGSFRDPALYRRALGLFLGDAFDPRELNALLRLPPDDMERSEIRWEFLRDNFDALARRLPEETLARLPYVAGAGLCDAARGAELEAFFRGRVARLPGATRTLAQALEQIRLCSSQRDAQRAAVAAFLKSRPPDSEPGGGKGGPGSR